MSNSVHSLYVEVVAAALIWTAAAKIAELKRKFSLKYSSIVEMQELIVDIQMFVAAEGLIAKQTS